MLRLSKRSWNNVIIFAMLLMILLFNTSNNILNQASDSSTERLPLLPSDGVLMSLDFGGISVERIGQGWRTKPQGQYNESELMELIADWQRALMKPTDVSPDTSQQVVVAWMAGEPKGRVYQLFDAAPDTLVLYDQQMYVISDKHMSEFVLDGSP